VLVDRTHANATAPAQRAGHPTPAATGAAGGFATVLAEQTQDGPATTRDFSRMTVGELNDEGIRLFRNGEITLDELFHFQNPTGTFQIVGGDIVRPGPDTPLDFVQRIQKAVTDLEQTGHAWLPQSSYPVYQSLLAKLQAWQA